MNFRVATRALAASVLLFAAAACRRAADTAIAAPAPPRDAAGGRAEAALAEGDRAFAARGDPARLEAAIAAYGRASALRPGDPAAELRLARAEAFRAIAASPPSRDAWDASARAAERALRSLAPAWAEAIDRGEDPAGAAARVDAPGAEALYLLAQGVMRGAQATGYAAVLAVKDAALAMAARAAELDERVDAAGPHRALGAWRAALPLAAGGGAAASRAHFERARALAPEDLLGPVAEAETYAVLVQDEGLFERLLRQVIEAAGPADVAGGAPAERARPHSAGVPTEGGAPASRAPENEVARRRAKELLARKARLF